MRLSPIVDDVAYFTTSIVTLSVPSALPGDFGAPPNAPA